MHIRVNGARLYFDVEGAGLVHDGPRLRERPTLLLLHGGPGADHTLYKPLFSALADVAQVVYLDHRGNGRSERGTPAGTSVVGSTTAAEAGSSSEPRDWNLAQWADDVRGFCDALGIVRPIVYGASFGGMVAMAYAARHPGHASRLVLVSTAASWHRRDRERVAMFQRLGGDEAGALARRRFIDGDASPAVLAAWLKIAVPLYTQRPHDVQAWQRMAANPEATAWFNRPGDGEMHRFDHTPALASWRCPTLLMAGALDPMTPVECQRDIAAALPPALVEAHEFDACGHGVVGDVPELALPLLRRFIAA